MASAVWLTLGYLLYIPLIWWAGNALCRLVFALATVEVTTKGEREEQQALKAGRYIGLFERLLVTLGVILYQWEIIIAVIALKTVARYRELDDQITAEYFLVGSLVSLLWAVLVSVALLVFDREIGVNFLQWPPRAIADP